MSHLIGTAQSRVSSVSGASAAQVRANRRNAKRSTGPRSDDGKRRSARNGITHGLYCRDLILPGESRREYLALRLGFHCDLKATDGVEFAIVERAVIAQWRMKRAQAGEAELHANYARAVGRRVRRQIAKLQAEVDDVSFHITEAELRAQAAARPRIDIMQTIADNPVPAGTTLAVDFASGKAALERLARHEHRLEHHFYKALRELRAYRKDKRDNGDGRESRPYVDITAMTADLLACEPEGSEEAEAPMESEENAETELPFGVNELSDHPEPSAAEDETIAPKGVATPCVSNVQSEPNFAESAAASGVTGSCASPHGETAPCRDTHGRATPVAMPSHPVVAVSPRRSVEEG